MLFRSYYFEDGSVEMIYGTQVKFVNEKNFLDSMKNKERYVSAGTNVNGEPSAIIGTPVEIKMQDGRKSIAIVGKMQMEYISNALSLEDEDSILYSFVIRKDGSFVIRTAGAFRESYFDRARERYSNILGKKDVEQFISELQQSMEKSEDYSVMLKMNGERHQMYCSDLPLSEWYLITIMPYGTLNEVVEQQGKMSLVIFLISCALLLGVLILVFIKYFNLNRMQIGRAHV